ncbi:hypothetical protein HQ49_03575 [Porphyromonas gulae]|nr:hypothetical protein HQ49_03575 [Porphyromonas gulae]
MKFFRSLIVNLLRSFKDSYASRKVVFIFDLLISCIASAISFFCVYFFLNKGIEQRAILFSLYLATAFFANILFSLLFGLYRGIIRHSTFREISKVFYFSICKGTILFLVGCAFFSIPLVFFVTLIDILFTLFLLLAFRTTVVYVYHILNRTKAVHGKALVVGMDSSSVALAYQITNASVRQWDIQGFIVRDPNLRKMRLNGLPIFDFNTVDRFAKIISTQGVKTLLFTNEDVFDQYRDIVTECIARRIKLFICQKPIEQADPKGRRMMREIQVEDLLGRTPIFLNMESIGHELKEKSIMVTGAAGSIGSEIVRQLAKLHVKHIILFDMGESPLHEIRLELERDYPNQKIAPVIGDVRCVSRLDYVLQQFQPEIIFHAAAYKHVPLMEENPCEAVLDNLIGTTLIARKAIEYGVQRMVMVSTDKAVNPTNVMGATKRAAEMVVQSLDQAIKDGCIQGHTRFVTTRFGNVLGSNGSVIPFFRKQIAAGGPVTVTHPDIIRYFMTIPEACQLVLEAGSMSEGGEIFVFDMGEPVKIYDLAKRMITLAGYEPDRDIEIVFSGLRPGEKLYEELLNNKENTKPTIHPKIQIAETRKVDIELIERLLPLLEQKAKDVDMTGTVRLLKEMVPEFVSKNSIYEELDNERTAV